MPTSITPARSPTSSSSLGAQLAVMKDDVAAMESGDRNDFKYANDFVYPGVKVDRVLRDGDTIKMGERAAHRLPHARPHARRDHLGR